MSIPPSGPPDATDDAVTPTALLTKRIAMVQQSLPGWGMILNVIPGAQNNSVFLRPSRLVLGHDHPDVARFPDGITIPITGTPEETIHEAIRLIRGQGDAP